MPDPTRRSWDPEFSGKKTAQRLTQRRALRVAGVVVLDPIQETLGAGRAPVTRRLLRADPYVQQCQVLIATAATGSHERRRAAEPPAIHTALRRNRRRARQHVIAREHARRAYELTDLICDHMAKLGQSAPCHNYEWTELRYGIDP